MKGEPLVSVVIPFLNGVTFLQEAIDSIFDQTYQHWELLLVDDGSSDESSNLARQYAERHPGRVRYLEHIGHTNRGASASRNLGSRAARGEFVAFLDADDVALPGRLGEQVAILEAHREAGWVYGRSVWWFGWTGRPEDAERDSVSHIGVPPNSVIRYSDLLTLYLRDENTVPSSFAIMVRRDVLDRAGGGSEETCRTVYDDQVAFAKLALEAPAYVADNCWCKYRQHPESRCSAMFQAGEYYLIRLQFIEWLRDHLTSNDGVDDQLMATLNTETAIAHVGCGRIGQGVENALNSLETGNLDKLLKATIHGAMVSSDREPPDFVRDVFAQIPESVQAGRMRRSALGEVNVELATRHRRAGRGRLAWRHVFRAVLASPSFARHRGVVRVAVENLIGAELIGRVRVLRERLVSK